MTMTATDSVTPAAAHRLTGQRDFRLLWTGYAVSSLGSEVTVLALPLAAAVMLHASPLQMGLLTAAGTAPVLALGLLAGVWVDRLPRRRPLLVTADLLAAAVLATVPLAYLLGALTVTQLIAVELAIGSCRVLFRPAYSSHLTDVVRREELTQASGHLRTAESGATLLGPGLGGLLIQLVTAPLAVAIDAASFVVSAVCLRRLRSPERERASSARPRHLRRELAEGLNAVLGDPSLRAIAGAAANLNLFGMLVMALFVVYATRSLGFTAGMVGAIVTLGGIGALSGAVLAPRVAARIAWFGSWVVNRTPRPPCASARISRITLP